MKIITKQLLIVIALMFGFSGFSLAQSSRPLNHPDFIIKAVNEELGDTELSNSSLTSRNAFEITTSGDNKKASLMLSSVAGRGNISMVLSAPLGDGKGSANLYTVDATSGATSVKVNYQWVRFDPDLDAIELTRLFDACRSGPAAFGLATTKDCDQKTTANLVSSYDKSKDDRSIYEIVDIWRGSLNAPLLQFGVTGEYGTKDFEYFSGTDVTLEKNNKEVWSAGGYLSLGNASVALVTLEYKYQEDYKSADEVVRCPTSGDGGFVDCVSAQMSAPARNINRNWSLGLRMPVPGGKAAISPKFTYDTVDDAAAFGLPVYFFQDDKGNLTGGVRADWNNVKDEWKFGIFAGAKF